MRPRDCVVSRLWEGDSKFRHPTIPVRTDASEDARATAATSLGVTTRMPLSQTFEALALESSVHFT